MEEDFTVWFTVMRFEEKCKIKAKLNRKSLMAHGIELGVNHLISICSGKASFAR